MDWLQMTRNRDWIVEPRHGRWQLHVLGGRRHRYGPDWGSGGRCISSDFARLYLPRSGTGTVATAAGTRRLRAGRFCFVPPGCRAVYGTARGLDLAWIHLRLEVLPGISAWRRQPAPAERPAARADGRRMAHAIALLAAPRPADDLAATALVAGLTAPFLPASWSAILPPVLDRLAPVLRHIDEHLSEPMDLADLAALVHLHPTYFSNLFSRAVGAPPLRYLVDRRLARACELLAGGDDAVGQVAGRCGFADPLYFSRAFRRRYGMPPSRWRAAQTRMR